MPRARRWVVDGVEVTRADVRRWMQSVGHRIPERSWTRYTEDYQVPAKIARLKVLGIFDQVVAQDAQRAGVKVRAARRPGPVARLRAGWPHAANAPTWRRGVRLRLIGQG